MNNGNHRNEMTLEMRLLDKYMRISRHHRAVMERMLSTTGVYRSQHKILMTISHNPNISQKELADRNEVSTATIAVSLKKLEKGGYIKRLVDEKDNRYNQICITQKGQEIVEKSHQIFTEVDEAMFAGLSEEEYQILEAILDKIYSNLEEYGQIKEKEREESRGEGRSCN